METIEFTQTESGKWIAERQARYVKYYLGYAGGGGYNCSQQSWTVNDEKAVGFESRVGAQFALHNFKNGSESAFAYLEPSDDFEEQDICFTDGFEVYWITKHDWKPKSGTKPVSIKFPANALLHVEVLADALEFLAKEVRKMDQ